MPIIFNANIQKATESIKEKTQLDVKLNDWNIDKLRFLDDIVIIAENTRNIQNHGEYDK